MSLVSLVENYSDSEEESGTKNKERTNLQVDQKDSDSDIDDKDYEDIDNDEDTFRALMSLNDNAEFHLEKSPKLSVANLLVSTNKIANLFSFGDEEPNKALNSSEENKCEHEYGVLDKYLPPIPSGECAPELQKIFEGIYERAINENYDINKVIQQKKEFRNPSIYEKLIEYCEINEFGTNFPSDIYNPSKWGPSSYYDELAKTQKVAMEQIENEQKAKKQKTGQKISSTTKNTTQQVLDNYQ